MISPYMQQRQAMKNGTKNTSQQQRAEDREKHGNKSAKKIASEKEAKKTPKNKIKKVSVKRAEENKEYKVAAKSYLKAHAGCEAHVASNCTTIAKEIHHKRKKRTKDDRINPEHFLAVCRPCHLWIEAHPKQSLELGLSKKAID